MPDYKTTSLLSLGMIPADTQEGREALSAAINLWVKANTVGQWPRALQSFENAAFLLGNHTTRFHYDTSYGLGVSSSGQPIMNGQFDAVVPPVVDNRLVRAVESMVGLLTEIQPAPRVTPNSDLPEDEDSAAIAEIVLQLYYERPLRMPSKLREAAMIGAIFEGCIAEVDYSETGEHIEVPKVKYEKQLVTATGEEVEVPVQDGTTVEARRDIALRMWTPLHIQVDPGATTPDDLTWISRSTFEDVDAIRARFEQGGNRTAAAGFLLEKGENVPTDSGSNHPLFWYTRIADLLPTPVANWGAGTASGPLATTGALPNQTLFTVIDVRPTAEFPRGRTLIVAGGKLIYAGDARSWSEEYPWRWHPYSFWNWFKVPGKFFGMPMLSELVPLQKRINAIDHLVQKHREHLAIGQWWLPKHAKVKPGGISGIPAEQYEYNAVQGLPGPERVSNDPFPAELLAERERLEAAIEYISSTGMLDASISESAARAGVILDFIRNEKLRNKGPMLREYESFVENISQNILIELQLNMRREDPELTDRIRRAAREHSDLAIQGFVGASLRDHHSVKIDIATELRHSPEAAAASAMEFLQYKQGQVTDAENAGILEATNLSKYIRNETDASVQRARRMISRISQGMMEAFLPMPGVDVPSVMVPEFQRAILADRFLDYPAEVKQALIAGFDHYKGEVAREMAEAMQQQMQMQAMMAGGEAAGASAGEQAAEPAEEPAPA